MVRRKEIQVATVRRTLIGIGAAVTIACAAGTASAQTSSYQSATDNVVINWGALDGTATPPRAATGTMPSRTGGLLVPGPTMPQSKLYVTPPPSGSGTVTLNRPPAETPAPAPMPKPTPAPPKAVATAAPAEPAKPAPTPKPAAEAPAKLAEAPATPAATPAAPPPPPPAAEAAVPAAPAPPPIPAAPSAAPQPTKTAEANPAESKPDTAPQAASVAPSADVQAQVLFNGDDTKLSADGQGVLDGVVSTMAEKESLRVQLMAYAAGEDLTSSKARRISLSRALSVRSYLIEKGVRSTRIDVRALGDKADGTPQNRVDINLIER